MFIEPKVSIINGWTNECRLDLDFQEFCLQVLFECVSKDRPALLQVRTVCWKVENFTGSSGSVCSLSSSSWVNMKKAHYILFEVHTILKHIYFVEKCCLVKLSNEVMLQHVPFKINSSEIGLFYPNAGLFVIIHNSIHDDWSGKGRWGYCWWFTLYIWPKGSLSLCELNHPLDLFIYKRLK